MCVVFRLQRQLGIPATDGLAPILPATPGAVVTAVDTKLASAAGEDLSESNYDPFTGYASALFSTATNYDAEGTLYLSLCKNKTSANLKFTNVHIALFKQFVCFGHLSIFF